MMVFGALASAATAFIGEPALDDGGEGRAAAQRDVDAVGGQRLHHLGVAAERADLDVEAVLLEDAGFDADVGRHEGELVGLGLADPEFGFGAGPCPHASMQARTAAKRRPGADRANVSSAALPFGRASRVSFAFRFGLRLCLGGRS